MTTHTTFVGTPDDLKAIMTEVVVPLVERIRELELMAGSHKHAYTVREFAKQIGFHPHTVLDYVHDGRKARNGVRPDSMPRKYPKASTGSCPPTWMPGSPTSKGIPF